MSDVSVAQHTSPSSENIHISLLSLIVTRQANFVDIIGISSDCTTITQFSKLDTVKKIIIASTSEDNI